MAVLGDSERFEVWAQVMREQPMPGITKPELRAAVNALDTWLNDNAAAANAALPQPARGALTVEQKAALLSYVIARRYLVERGG